MFCSSNLTYQIINLQDKTPVASTQMYRFELEGWQQT